MNTQEKLGFDPFFCVKFVNFPVYKSMAVKGMSKRIGYARVSTDDQNLDLQRDALTRSGCATIYEETASCKSPLRLRVELEHCRKALWWSGAWTGWGALCRTW